MKILKFSVIFLLVFGIISTVCLLSGCASNKPMDNPDEMGATSEDMPSAPDGDVESGDTPEEGEDTP